MKNRVEVMKTHKVRISAQSGFSMIEVLIAVLVLAIGLLGVAGVQLVSMQQTMNSTLRSEATMYAHSVAERVRSSGGGGLAATELDALKKQMKVDLGADADVQVNLNGTTATINVSWTERDSFSDAGGVAVQTLTINARL